MPAACFSWKFRLCLCQAGAWGVIRVSKGPACSGWPGSGHQCWQSQGLSWGKEGWAGQPTFGRRGRSGVSPEAVGWVEVCYLLAPLDSRIHLEVTGPAFVNRVRPTTVLKACAPCGLVLEPHVIVPTKSRSGTLLPNHPSVLS